MTEIGLSITGLQEAQADNLKRIAAFEPKGEVAEGIKEATLGAHRYAVSITHVWPVLGGGLRASHRAEIKGLHGRIYIDPNAVNPRKQMPSIYGFYENRRGGTHAFYDRTVEEFGDEATGIVMKRVGRI